MTPAMEPIKPGLFTLTAPEGVRLGELERVLARIRWFVVPFAAITVALDAGRNPVLAATFPGLVALTNLVVLVAVRRIRHVGGLRALGLVVTVADGLVATVAMFNYAASADTSTQLLPVLVIMEAAVRWARREDSAPGPCSPS